MRTRLIAVLMALAAVAVFTTEASAMYHAGMGRFLQRDPGAGSAGPARISAAGPARGGGFAQRDPITQPPNRVGNAGLNNQYADGMNFYQYVGSNPVNWVDYTGNGKEKPGAGSAPEPGQTPNPGTQPAGRGSTCGIQIKRSAICKIFGQTKPSDFGHEWLEIPDGAGGTAYADFPSGGRNDPYITHRRYGHDCHRYERAHPMWVWNAHVRFFGGSLPSGKSCGEATCAETRECMLSVMDDWSGRDYSFFGSNCIDFVNEALSKCCMARGALPTRIPKPFEELKSCCEREKDMDSMPGCNGAGGGPS